MSFSDEQFLEFHDLLDRLVENNLSQLIKKPDLLSFWKTLMKREDIM